jgi:cardiolipin synthase A/B
VVIHSTFLSRERFDLFVPALRVAAAHGCRVEILWGQSKGENGFVRSLQEARSIEKHLEETGLAGSVFVHLSSTRSHAKVLIADDGAGAIHATVGSCNWLYSGFDSFEASVRLRDPRLVSDVLNEVAELARPRDGQLPDLTVRLAQTARELLKKPALSGNSRLRVVIDEEHDDCLLEARDQAQRSITVMSHRLGVTAKPAVVIPAAAAVRDRGIAVELLYAIPSGPVEQADAAAARWHYEEEGVTLRATQRPRLHAKMLLWDEDEAVVTSLNWLSADATNKTPRGEIGIRISSTRAADHLREAYKHAQILT